LPEGVNLFTKDPETGAYYFESEPDLSSGTQYYTYDFDDDSYVPLDEYLNKDSEEVEESPEYFYYEEKSGQLYYVHTEQSEA
jgi:hypothetical protein